MHLPVASERVFEALDSNEGRGAFWAESAEEIDGHVHFQFVNGHSYRSRIVQRRPPFLWTIDYFGGEARFELSPDGVGGTDLLMTHEGVGLEEWNEVHAGWLNVLFPLKAYVVHGVDLRNHDPTRTWNEGYADQ
ncbi:MAG: hypothetical protein OEO23_07715 [Gemmatimonadota bacterium]|nr:hypothetical protein [Gemmatimonadota bacterium]